MPSEAARDGPDAPRSAVPRVIWHRRRRFFTMVARYLLRALRRAQAEQEALTPGARSIPHDAL